MGGDKKKDVSAITSFLSDLYHYVYGKSGDDCSDHETVNLRCLIDEITWNNETFLLNFLIKFESVGGK